MERVNILHLLALVQQDMANTNVDIMAFADAMSDTALGNYLLRHAARLGLTELLGLVAVARELRPERLGPTTPARAVAR